MTDTESPRTGADDAVAVAADDNDDFEVEVPRRRHTALMVSVAVAVVLAALVGVLATRKSATDRQAQSPLVGKVAPEIAGETLGGGNFNIDDYRGQWVVVNFFATWCLPCRREHPELVAFDEEHRQLGDAVLVSVLYDDDPDTAGDYFAENGGDWPLVLDGEGRVATDYGVAGVPETYLISPNSRVAAKLTGGVTRDGINRMIEQMEAQL